MVKTVRELIALLKQHHPDSEPRIIPIGGNSVPVDGVSIDTEESDPLFTFLYFKESE